MNESYIGIHMKNRRFVHDFRILKGSKTDAMATSSILRLPAHTKVYLSSVLLPPPRVRKIIDRPYENEKVTVLIRNQAQSRQAAEWGRIGWKIFIPSSVY